MQRPMAAKEAESESQPVPRYKNDINSTLCMAQGISQKRVLADCKRQTIEKAAEKCCFQGMKWLCKYHLRANRVACPIPTQDSA